MNINIDKDTVITIAAWLAIMGLFFLLLGQIGEMRSDIDNMRDDIRELQKKQQGNETNFNLSFRVSRFRKQDFQR